MADQQQRTSVSDIKNIFEANIQKQKADTIARRQTFKSSKKDSNSEAS